MAEINICNSVGRDAVVAAASVATRKQIRWVDNQYRQASSVRLSSQRYRMIWTHW